MTRAFDASLVFEGTVFTREDDLVDCGARRVVKVGSLRDRVFVLVWAPRLRTTHVVSMRKADARGIDALGRRAWSLSPDPDYTSAASARSPHAIAERTRS